MVSFLLSMYLGVECLSFMVGISFKFLRDWSTIFHNNDTILHYNRECESILVVLHPPSAIADIVIF